MQFDSRDDNPYAAPSRDTDGGRPRTRWRIAVATALAIFGAICILGTPIPLLVASGRPMELGGGIRMNYILGTTAQVAAGMAWFRGSVFAWQARWRALALAVGAALMFAAIAQGLFMDLGL